MKTDTVTIEIRAPKKERQIIVDKIHELILGEDLLPEGSHDVYVSVTSTLEPSEEE